MSVAKRKRPVRKRPVKKHRAIAGQDKQGHCKGFFHPKNVEKYVGDINKIVYRSSWEKDFMNFLDNNLRIIKWGSETIPIPYVKPTTGRVHKYYPDFFVEYFNRQGKIVQDVVEVKPKKQVLQPTTRGKSKKTQLYEALAWAVNNAKWDAARLFCDKYGYNFVIMSEGHIFK
jgi:hypothetical protein